MTKIICITLIAYVMGLVGFLGGTLFSVVTHKLGRKFHGMLMGFTAGLLIAFVCFAMLPLAFATSGLEVGVVGILLGVAASALLENMMEKTSGGTHALKMGLLITLGVVLHKIPEGMAIGSMLNINMAAGLSMSAIVAIHCFPEAVAVTFSLREGGMSCAKLFAACFLICLPMALGAFFGAALSNISNVFVSLCLSFAGGVMIYVTCGEIIPESKEIWKGSISTVGALAGFALGVILTAKM